MNGARSWRYPFAVAQELAGDELLERGDELGLRWRGQLQKPELARRGVGRRAIVVDVIDLDGIPTSVVIALIEEGRRVG